MLNLFWNTSRASCSFIRPGSSVGSMLRALSSVLVAQSVACLGFQAESQLHSSQLATHRLTSLAGEQNKLFSGGCRFHVRYIFLKYNLMLPPKQRQSACCGNWLKLFGTVWCWHKSVTRTVLPLDARILLRAAIDNSRRWQTLVCERHKRMTPNSTTVTRWRQCFYIK